MPGIAVHRGGPAPGSRLVRSVRGLREIFVRNRDCEIGRGIESEWERTRKKVCERESERVSEKEREREHKHARIGDGRVVQR